MADEDLRARLRRARVSPDDEALSDRALVEWARAGDGAFTWLRARLCRVLALELEKRPLDLDLEIGPDAPLHNVLLYVNGEEMPFLNTDAFKVLFITDTKVRLWGGFVHGDLVTAEGDDAARTYRVVDPRFPTIAGVPESDVRHVCNDCDEALDQHGYCLCSIGLCPTCPTCGGSGYDDTTAHHSVPEPCRDCFGECTLAAYERNMDARLRD